MALILSNSDNTFEGATVIFEGNKFQVYKVNKKSMYVGEMTYKDVMKIKESILTGYTFKKLMTKVNARMVKFGTYQVSEEEAARKVSFDTIKDLKKNNKTPMTKNGELHIDLLYDKRFLTGKGNYKSPSEIENHRIIVVMFNKDKWSVLNIDGIQYLYDLKYNVYTPFNKDLHKDGINVLFPERTYEVKSEKTA